jgi:hypothetical protein
MCLAPRSLAGNTELRPEWPVPITADSRCPQVWAASRQGSSLDRRSDKPTCSERSALLSLVEREGEDRRRQRQGADCQLREAMKGAIRGQFFSRTKNIKGTSKHGSRCALAPSLGQGAPGGGRSILGTSSYAASFLSLCDSLSLGFATPEIPPFVCGSAPHTPEDGRPTPPCGSRVLYVITSLSPFGPESASSVTSTSPLHAKDPQPDFVDAIPISVYVSAGKVPTEAPGRRVQGLGRSRHLQAW